MYYKPTDFCSCPFVDSIYLLGGFSNYITNSCLAFNTTKKTWKIISRMNESRYNASCAVFEGIIFVSGGHNDNGRKLNTAEAYDHIDDSWTNMQSMNVERHSHKSVAIKN